VEQQKVARDVMLNEAQEKKIKEAKDLRKKEIHEVEVLKKEILDEQQMKVQKRKQEMDDAWKVIKQNEVYREKRMQEKEIEKAAQVKLIEEFNEMMDKQEEKRLREWE